jgi:hypothetical protein
VLLPFLRFLGVARVLWATRSLPVLRPNLACFPLERIFICAQEDLPSRRRPTMRALYRFAGVEDSFRSPAHERRWNVSRAETSVSLERTLRGRLAAELSDDAARLQELAGRGFPGWLL